LVRVGQRTTASRHRGRSADGPAKGGRGAGKARLQSLPAHHAAARGAERLLPLAPRAQARAHAAGWIRVGQRVLHQPHATGGGSELPPADGGLFVKILFVASEAAPYVKTGGLGDVIGALPRALAGRGHDVMVIIPRYGVIDGPQFGLRDTGRRVEVQFPNLNAGAHIHVHVPAERLRYLFLQNPWYDRKELYGEGGKDYRDNHKRFALLCAGALEAAKQQGFQPDAVHAHDWQAALVPLIMKRGWAGRPPPFRARCVFTIHNVAYQGIFPREAVVDLGLPGDLFNADALEFYGQLNLMKAGLVFAEKLTTVSPTYAREIVESPETGAGLEGLLRHRRQDLVGIMNGVDYEGWNPETDANLEQRYTVQDLAGKAAD